MERGLFRFTLQRPVNGFLISLGMILILQNALVARWGATQQNVGAAFGTVWQLGELRVSADRLLIIGVTAVSFVLLHHLLVRTRVGTAVRAAAMDRETAGLMAVPVPRIITLTFITGGVLAAIAGSLLASIYPIMPSLGSAFVVKGFAVALVGGLGNIKGAMLAALVIGIAEAMLAGLGYGGWTDAVSFALMIAILLFRPQGLLRGTDGSY
jgi:branched-chain amino acid transport system permease protein